jgi:hypothetical protein
MLAKPDRKQLEALANVAKSSWWTEVKRLLDEEYTATVTLMIGVTDEVALRQSQGRAKFLHEFMNLVQQAAQSRDTSL